MVRPSHALLVFFGVGIASGIAAAESQAPLGSRNNSTHMRQALLEAAQQRAATAAATQARDTVAEANRPRLPDAAPANEIIRLPSYIVRQRKLPEVEEVLTEPELAKVAMRRYLGDERGLDRTLNVITIRHLWKKLPVLGRYRLLDFETNEERALRIYREKKTEEQWAEIGEFRAMMQPGTSPLKKK